MNGEGRRYLAVPQTRSSGSSDLHSGKAEVRIQSEMMRFINRVRDRHNVQINVGSEDAGDEMKPGFINVKLKTN